LIPPSREPAELAEALEQRAEFRLRYFDELGCEECFDAQHLKDCPATLDAAFYNAAAALIRQQAETMARLENERNVIAAEFPLVAGLRERADAAEARARTAEGRVATMKQFLIGRLHPAAIGMSENLSGPFPCACAECSAIHRALADEGQP
jgi:hypothetical protein